MSQSENLPSRRTALVNGVHGLIGSYVAEDLLATGDWDVIGVSRRGGVSVGNLHHEAVDLLDRDALDAVVARHPDITDLFFAAYAPGRDPAHDTAMNAALMDNTLDALRTAGAPVRHAVLYEGGKAYGAHLGPFRTPAKESDPRVDISLFYYEQEDSLWNWAADTGAGWTILRPDCVSGVGLGNPINMLAGLAAYAVICRELGQPLHFPGTEASWRALNQTTDARIIARASRWAVDAPTARDQIFNLTNGDEFRWCNEWQAIADWFGMEPGQIRPVSLVETMADKGPVWDGALTRAGLAPLPLDSMAAWGFTHAMLNIPFDLVTSSVKIRQAGFGECIDTTACFADVFDAMADRGLIPN